MSARILIVDDHPLTREALSSLLGAHGLDVIGCASDGAEAIVEAARLQPDLVLLDLSMPGVDGLTALPRLREAAPDCEVVRSEEHTSELQSHVNLVCRLLLEK